MDRASKEHAIGMLSDILAPIGAYLARADVQEIMINAPNEVWVEERGITRRLDVELGDVAIRSAIDMLARIVGKVADKDGPGAIVDARLEGLRFAAALESVSAKGPSICIRRHSPVVLSLEDYVEAGALDPVRSEVLRRAVTGRKNILVSGGTSSGKTTALNAMIALIGRDERLVTIEDTRELRVEAPNWVAFEANEQAGVAIRHLVKLALRYRPDRIIVGEVRGPEAFDLMQAMNTGHDGGIATIHANSARDALARLEGLVLTTPDVDWPLEAIRDQIGRTFDYVIHMERAKLDGRTVRRFAELAAIERYDHERGDYVISILKEGTTYEPSRPQTATA